VFEGLPMDEAAHKVGLTTFQVRQAFSRTHVINHLKKRREVFRASVCGANVHRLAEIRDAANNIPAVQAIGMLERMDLEPAATRATQATPGLVIVVQGGVKQLEPPQRTLDVRTVENVNVPND
jgi:ABC-type branched-subunit amino acid transport system ATPase component